jgi:hypothetical protein
MAFWKNYRIFPKFFCTYVQYTGKTADYIEANPGLGADLQAVEVSGRQPGPCGQVGYRQASSLPQLPQTLAKVFSFHAALHSQGEYY